MNFKDKVRLGLFTEKRVEIPEGTQHCLNCGNDFEGAYCPKCGQYWKVTRITFSNMIDTIVSVIAGFQANLPRTVLDLLYRPGYLVNDYISGKRKVYTNPFSLLLLLATITLLFNQLFMAVDIRDMTIEGSSSIPGLGNDYSQSDLAKTTTRLIYDFYGLYNLSIIPVFGVPFWLTYRKQGRFKENHLNIYESFVAVGFYSCFGALFNLVSMPFMTCENMMSLSFVSVYVSLPVFLIMTWQLFEMKPFQFLFRALVVFPLFFLLFMFVLMILIFIGSIIYGIITYVPKV